MTTNRKKRQQLRTERQQAEARAAQQERRRRGQKIIALIVAVLLGAILAVGVVVVNQANTEKPAAPRSSASSNNQLLAGIEQNDLTLGSPQAPVKIVEFADLRCPYCAILADQGIKELIAGPVRDGQVQLEFRHWAVVPGSADVARGMYAAAEQGRGWQFIKNLYGQQGEESGTVDFEKIKRIAEQSGVPDIAKWEEDYQRPEWDQRLLEVEDQALDLNLGGTPSIAVERDGQLQVTDLNYQSTGADFQQLIRAQQG